MDRSTGNVDRSEVQRVALASAIGCIIEWYDFFLYGVVAGLGFAAAGQTTQHREALPETSTHQGTFFAA